ncbi:TrmH family RNA methyltransferase [Fusobacterium mortiferum]|uniref:TrmH family RNA methyltransferase n=1 Tax=Fusobacterium mortiferum TaxID=850 RepID=UPI000E4DF0D1|nr:RNA methyltransferase [Fusobacterium mortiferum]MCI6380940.1 RNA methyltransferase [Fusobacterium mortiferum]RHF67097.1 RNA methyltransferase [Fusobacterium mortiferum]
MEFINSLDNSTIKKIKKLKQRKYREEEKKFLAEGRKFLDFTYTPDLIILKENFEDFENITTKLERFDCRKIVVNDKIFKDLTSQENSQGVILVYPYCETNIGKINNNIIVLDKIQDPGNLGTIIRAADAAGFKDIILSKGSVDCYNEKCVRSSMGSIFNMNIVYMEELQLIQFLKEKKYKFLVTALENNSIEYTDITLNEKNAIIFGSEGNGVSDNFLKAADETVIIPIYGSAESLNVAMASGIILYKVRELMNK